MRNLLLLTATWTLSALALATEPARVNVGALTDESRQLAATIIDQIRGELVSELERTGPLRAILVCKFSAPEITSRLSRQHGMRITRVALRARNPSVGEADAWEQRVLLDFEKKAAQGTKLDGLDHAEVVTEPNGRYFRYMRAITTGAPCLMCHGTKLSEAVKAQLRIDYPLDRGADYELGQLRGAVSIKKNL